MFSFWWSEIRMWQLSSDFVNYLSFRFYRHLTIGKQQCRPHRLPGIAYPFSWKGVRPRRKRPKMKGSFELCRENLWEKSTIVKFKNSLEDTSVCNMLLKAVCLTSTSLALHSNVIEKLQKFHELQNPRITLN